MGRTTRNGLMGAITAAGAFCLIAGASADSIGKGNVNVHADPSLESKVVFEAPLGYPIEIEKRQGDWVYVKDWQGATGWVYKPLVSDIDTAVIVVDKANLRNGPGLDHKVIGEAEEGEIYKILGKTGDWLNLGFYKSGDGAGWVRSDLVFGS